MVAVRPRARVYVDGFNFDYAAFRWLDLSRFFDVVLPDRRLRPSAREDERPRAETDSLRRSAVPLQPRGSGALQGEQCRGWLCAQDEEDPEHVGWVREHIRNGRRVLTVDHRRTREHAAARPSHG